MAACEELDGDREVGAVVVRGEGGFFCAGGDRGTLEAAGRDPADPEVYAGSVPSTARSRAWASSRRRPWPPCAAAPWAPVST